jgi:hypothetical protein
MSALGGQKAWKPSLLIWIDRNRLKFQKTTKGILGKLGIGTTLLWKYWEKAWSERDEAA